MIELIARADTALFLFLNARIANPVFDWFFPVITNGRFWIVPLTAFALVYLKVERKRAVVGLTLAILTVAISDPLCCRVIKPLVHRPRPCHPDFLVQGARFLIGMKRSPSFPSAHAMNWFAQATLFTFLYPRRWWWFFAFAVPVAFSRVYVGVHYPVDVCVGALFGAVAGAAVYGGYRVVTAQLARRHRRPAPEDQPAAPAGDPV